MDDEADEKNIFRKRAAGLFRAGQAMGTLSRLSSEPLRTEADARAAAATMRDALSLMEHAAELFKAAEALEKRLELIDARTDAGRTSA